MLLNHTINRRDPKADLSLSLSLYLFFFFNLVLCSKDKDQLDGAELNLLSGANTL